jgi:cell fate regulator YaaT (PSP1 superfamily)
MTPSDKKCPRGKLHCYNYLSDIPGGYADFDIVEVQFKNTRKGFYRNSLNIPLEIGDMVAVEASPGHDIGKVSLIGRLVALQMKRAGIKPDAEIKRIFRKAKPTDLEKYEEAKSRENDTMIRARKIAESLLLNMKIGDVEYQGDGNKAIFYYIADERVDFRQLIKVLAETFKVRIEMKQIGARQEAGRIGGIGPCGRPLCCSSWMTNFVSVATSAARYQDISLNPQKLAGQCAKLKCCLNFEIDTYVESSKKLPPKDVRLETADATYYHFKTDIFKRELTYSTDKSIAANLVTIDAERAFEVIALNKQGEKPLQLQRNSDSDAKSKKPSSDVLSENSLTRFDKNKKKKRKPKSKEQKANTSTEGQPPVTDKAGKSDISDNNNDSNGKRQERKRGNRHRNSNSADSKTAPNASTTTDA